MDPSGGNKRISIFIMDKPSSSPSIDSSPSVKVLCSGTSIPDEDVLEVDEAVDVEEDDKLPLFLEKSSLRFMASSQSKDGRSAGRPVSGTKLEGGIRAGSGLFIWLYSVGTFLGRILAMMRPLQALLELLLLLVVVCRWCNMVLIILVIIDGKFVVVDANLFHLMFFSFGCCLLDDRSIPQQKRLRFWGCSKSPCARSSY